MNVEGVKGSPAWADVIRDAHAAVGASLSQHPITPYCTTSTAPHGITQHKRAPHSIAQHRTACYMLERLLRPHVHSSSSSSGDALQTATGRAQLASLFNSTVESVEWLEIYEKQRQFAGCGVANFPAQVNQPLCKGMDLWRWFCACLFIYFYPTKHLASYCNLFEHKKSVFCRLWGREFSGASQPAALSRYGFMAMVVWLIFFLVNIWSLTVRC
jgi:hypothetical protein